MSNRPGRSGIPRTVSVRALCMDALIRWEESGGLADAILRSAQESVPPGERALVAEIFYGVLRRRTELDFFISELREGGLDDFTRGALRVGLYQIFRMRIPDHAAVFETVASARRAAGLVNAVLRRAIREKHHLLRALESQPLHVRVSHPAFLTNQWCAQYGESDCARLCDWNNTPPPLYARLRPCAPGTMAAEFRDAGMCLPVNAGETEPVAAAFPDFMNVSTLPRNALQAGWVYMQDPSTSLAPRLLAPQPGDVILDACAAPGGKTAMLADTLQGNGIFLAADCSPPRLNRLRENLARMGLDRVRIIEADWTAGSIPDIPLCDRILVDVPCTNTGVLRRRVDARWRLRPEDFIRMPALQLQILGSVARFLRPGGRIVYSTCSIDCGENRDVVNRFLSAHRGFRVGAEVFSHPLTDGIDGAYAVALDPA